MLKAKSSGLYFCCFHSAKRWNSISATPSSVVEFSFLGSQARFDVAQALARGHLGEREREILVETRKCLDLVRFAIARHATTKGRQRQVLRQLREHEFAYVHGCPLRVS